jgi:succinate dehydrogenase / fumarate reductase membrane anchor subunit
MGKNFKETSKTGGLLWLFQRISAVILFVLLLVHFITYHFISEGVIKYSVIVDKMKTPWFNLVQFLFLITALYHGINGIWMIVEDYTKSKFWRIVWYSILVVGGVSLLFVGMLTIFRVGSLIGG